MIPRVYLAGPDVFHPDHARIFAERTSLCRLYGLEALVPLDTQAKDSTQIYQANVRLLDLCDAVIANITPFRGPHCDVGTAWEIGYAVGRSKPVFAFSDVSEPLASRIASGDQGPRTDASGMYVEDFGLAENLMIVESLVGQKVHGSFEAALEATVTFLKNSRPLATHS